MATSRPLCDICLRFPWHNLPAEDAGGVQHHASRRELEVSASTCPVCALVLRAAVANYSGSQGVRDGRGYWRQYNCISYKDASGLHLMNVVKELGACVPAAQITPSKHKSQTIVTDVPTRDLVVMAPGYRNGQTVLMPTGPVQPDGTVGPASPDQTTTGEEDVERETEDLPVWVYGNWWCHRDSRKAGLHPHLMGVGARFGRTASPWDAVNTKPGKVHLRGSTLRLRTNDGTSFGHIPGRIPEKDSASPLAFRRLQGWLEDCLTGHGVCAHGASEPALPPRVLDLNVARSFVRVIDGKGSQAAYATLSHAWSRSRHIETTKTNLAEHRRGIVLSELPPTFQDAVTIARRLGLRYLWVDALCIVQDDETDRDAQTAQMSSIYRNARIMISAASSADIYGGCFPLRTKGAVASPAAQSMGYDVASPSEVHSIGFLTGNGGPSVVHLSEEWLPGSSGALPQFSDIGAFGRHWDPIAAEALSRRGWALQERLLSRRTIHYTSSQMYFECQCGLQSEDGYHIPPQTFNVQKAVQAELAHSPGHKSLEEDNRASFTRGMTQPRRGPRRQAGWLSLVEDYSRRHVAEGRDKLVAIAGAARVISEGTGDEYLAGLWRGHLLEDLCWRVTAGIAGDAEQNKGSLRVGNPKTSRPSQYRAPSWSWASLDAPVEFGQVQQEQEVAEVVACSTTPRTADVFGAVTGGELEIMSPVFEIREFEPRPRQTGDAVSVLLVKSDVSGSEHRYRGSFYPDIANEEHFPCFALFLDHLHALVVQAESSIGEAASVLTSELVRKKARDQPPNKQWRCGPRMRRIGIVEFSQDMTGEEKEELEVDEGDKKEKNAEGKRDEERKAGEEEEEGKEEGEELEDKEKDEKTTQGGKEGDEEEDSKKEGRAGSLGRVLSEDEVSHLTLEDESKVSVMLGPVDKDDARIGVRLR